MLNKRRLGSEIKKQRKIKKLTQKQLAFEICDQSEISRIEAGDFFPNLDILYLISNRLQTSVSYFFEVLTHENVEETSNIRNKISTITLSKNYEELRRYTDNIMRENKVWHPEVEKFLKYKNLLARYYIKEIDYRYCLIEFQILLSQTTSGMDVLLDFQIKNSIANILAENKIYDKSMELYEEILNENLKVKEADKLKIKAFFNYGKLLYLKQEYEDALVQANKGIELSIETGDMTILGQFYFEKASIMEKLLHDNLEISANYKRAQFFFRLLNLNKHLEILEEKKGGFLL
ncbi:helix-turn-helix transcriptional regulator (plasmid) [Planococcus maritimus]|uniref:helix-turn-helix domain-containing protein n=1 Tax=Planococcus maritimus TaxID=192421 RepID=UPI003138B48E